MTPALRWAAMRAILMFHKLSGTVTRQCPRTTTFEEKGEPKRIWTKALLLINYVTAWLYKHTVSHVITVERLNFPMSKLTHSLLWQFIVQFVYSNIIIIRLRIHEGSVSETIQVHFWFGWLTYRERERERERELRIVTTDNILRIMYTSLLSNRERGGEK